MKLARIIPPLLSAALVFAAGSARAATVTVGPSGTYSSPCQAFSHLSNGDTLEVDANGGVPYNDSTDCTINASNLTIVGINGRPVIDGSGHYTSKGLWVLNGHDIVVDNFEFRNASGDPFTGLFRIQVGDGATSGPATDGGNITLQHSYLHDSLGQGAKGADANQYGSNVNWYSSNPYITFQYDEFYNNGAHNGNAQGGTHNMYMGYGGNMTFTLQYSWTHDSFSGHNIKTRAPYNNILYNLDTDFSGNSNYLLDDCLGSSDYAVGNVFEKSAVSTTSGTNASEQWFIFADYTEDGDGPEYDTSHQDLHFINNTVIQNNGYPGQFLSISCGDQSVQANCPAPVSGSAAESVKAVIENNLFIGPSGTILTNQSGAYTSHNIIQTYSDSQLAADFVDWQHYDFHLASGSPAIGAGMYPPTDNTGSTDNKAKALYEPMMPTGAVARPTPSGSTMDVGAYSYPRVDTPPTLSLSYTSSVTVPNSGTITVSGLPTPPSDSYNYAAFVSSNPAALPNPPSADSTTSSVTTTFYASPGITTSTVVPVDVYADGAHATASITVNPGPPVLSSITEDYLYQPFTSVNLEGPAASGGTVINLSSSNSTYLSVPSTVTVPQGQLSAETGSATGSLWGQSPGSPNVTVTATQGSVTKTVSFGVFTPGFHGTAAEYTSIQGGNPLAWCVNMVGTWPKGTNSISVTSDNTAVIPNQSITSGVGGCNGTLQGQSVSFNDIGFNGDIAIATNTVSTATTVHVTLTLNGDNTNGSGVANTTAITVTPPPAVPGAPSGLSASSSGSRPVNLSWTASSMSGVTYTVYRSTTSGFTPSSSNVAAQGLTGTTYADYSMLGGATYYYVVEADNSGSMSTASNQASASINADPASGTDVIAIDAGGTGSTPYVADTDFSGGSNDSISNTIDTSLVTNPAPQEVYQSERWGNFTYTIPGLTAGQNYIVRLHLAEDWDNGPGQRQFNVLINGTTVLSNFDIYVAAGDAMYKAVALNFAATANSSGQITIQTTTGSSDSPKLNGIEIQSVSSGTTLPLDINSGGSTSGTYIADTDVSGGGTASFSQTIDTSGVTNPAPQAVYQTERYGTFTYTIPGLTSGNSYTVRLHFAEDYWSSTGQRVFNVAINGTTVLSNFDIIAAAGAANKAIAETFTATANSSGQIVIAFTNGTADKPKLSGIEVTNATPSVTVSSVTQDSAYGPGTTVHLSGAAPTGGAVVSLSSSDSTVLYAPATMTVPAGQTSAEAGTQLGSWWGQSPSSKSAVLTATYNSSTQTLTANVPTSQIHGFGCDYTPCSVQGGNGLEVGFQGSFSGAPEGGGSIQVTSSNTSVIPNQSYSMTTGQSAADWYITTNAVSSTQTVTVNITYNGETYWSPLSVSVTP